MNKKIGIAAAVVNVISVFVFALSMIIFGDFMSYLSSIFIALSFVVLMGSFAAVAKEEDRAAANSAVAFSAVYAVIILLVYFAQCTTVRMDTLTTQASSLLDYQFFGLFFNYDLLGYGLMALSTFFIGLTIRPSDTADKWLKALLLIHGVFFISCLIMPMLGIFSANMSGGKWIGIAILEFWCVYFIPVGVLSILHFKKR